MAPRGSSSAKRGRPNKKLRGFSGMAYPFPKEANQDNHSRHAF
jgi:hypothetical protein